MRVVSESHCAVEQLRREIASLSALRTGLCMRRAARSPSELIAQRMLYTMNAHLAVNRTFSSRERIMGSKNGTTLRSSIFGNFGSTENSRYKLAGNDRGRMPTDRVK